MCVHPHLGVSRKSVYACTCLPTNTQRGRPKNIKVSSGNTQNSGQIIDVIIRQHH